SLAAKDRPAAALRAGIDRQHGHAMSARNTVQSKALDKTRFTGAGRAGDADPRRAPGYGQDRLDQPLGFGAVIGAGRLDKSHGARERAAAAAAQGCRQLLSGGGHRAGSLSAG